MTVQSNTSMSCTLSQLATVKDSEVPEYTLKGQIKECKIVYLYDGDTGRLVYESKPNEYIKLTFRVNGLDTPEMRPAVANPHREYEKALAEKARNMLATMLTNSPIDANGKYTKTEFNQLIDMNTKIVTIEFDEFDKYGRLLVNLIDCMHVLIGAGLAKKYGGGTKSAWVPEQLP